MPLIARFAEQADQARLVSPVLGDVHNLWQQRTHDAAIAIESSGYMDRERLFAVVARALEHGGWFGLQEHFLRDARWAGFLNDYYRTRLGTQVEYLAAARTAGFELTGEEDITGHAAEFWLQSLAWTTAELESGSSPIPPEPLIGWRLPPFYCPIPSVIHPRVAQLEQRAIQWLDTTGLYHDDVDRAWGLATHSAEFGCRVIPDGHEELLLLFIEWNHWAFAVDDDHHDVSSGKAVTAEVVDLNARIILTLEAPGSAMLDSADPFASALTDLAVRTRAATTPVQLARICAGMRDWLFGAAWLVGNDERGVMPALSDFAAIRPAVNGTRFSLAWSLAAKGIDLAAEQCARPAVQALTDLAGFIVSCDNDLFSYAKEDHLPRPEQNIINILIQHHHSSPQQALADAVRLRDRCMTRYLRLRDQLGRESGLELRRYLQALDHYIAGCLDWMNAAPRYASPRNRYPCPVAGATFAITRRDTPSDQDDGPPHIPSIRWWWDQHLG